MTPLSFKLKNRLGSNPNAILSALQKWRRAIVLFVLFAGMTLSLVMLTARPAAAAATCQSQHLIKQGETLAKIGQRYNINWTTIAQANNLSNPNRIYAGSYLCIPANNPPTTPPPASCQANHIVQRGESLSTIGVRYSVSWTSIAQANNLSNPNRIFMGQKLCIPSSNNQPLPSTPPPAATIPTIKVVSVVANQSVTINTSNFPANRQFDVLMGAYGTKGVNGTLVTTINSGAGGAFSVTFSIPPAWHGAERIAIRLQSPSGFYSYNWFHNNTSP